MLSTSFGGAAHAGVYRLADHEVARVGYGAMQLRRLEGNRAEAVALLRRAFDLGVNFVDTAEFYLDGFVNRSIAEAIRGTSKIVVATKVGADPNPGAKIPLRPAQRPEQLRASVEANLRSLGLEQLPIVYLRRLETKPGLAAEGDQIVNLDDQLAVMIAMREEGKIAAVGLSAVQLESLERAIPAGIACVQNAYSVASRRFEDMLELCNKHRIAWVPFYPLGGAQFPEYPKVVEQKKIIDIAARLDIKPSQVGLSWLLHHKSNIVLIPGTASIVHLEENVASASIAISKEIAAELDSIFDSTKPESASHRPQ
jgi:pyridoxine 4-dehydrogenase